jgi:protein-tyrosine phosphatase
MDVDNLRDLQALAAAAAPPGESDRIRLFGEIAGLGGQDIPDPYYGTAASFAHVLGLLEAGAANLVEQLGKLLRA